MNSPIDRAGEPAQLQVREQRVLSWQRWKEREQGSGRGRCLPDQHGPEGETGSSLRGRTVIGPVARFASTSLEKVHGPQPWGRKIWGHLLPPCQGMLPLMPWAVTVPRSPEAAAAGAKSPGPAEKQQPTREPAQGKTRPLPQFTSSSPGSAWPLTAAREGQAAPAWVGEGPSCPRSHAARCA